MGAAYIDLSDNATLARIECKCALEALFRRWPQLGLAGLGGDSLARASRSKAFGSRRVPISLVRSHLPIVSCRV
jgi:cytochrome P450